MRKHNFKQLIVWQKAMDVVDLAYNFIADLPSTERFNLIDQIRRCSVSIPSNIAEGSGKRTNKDFARYLSIALGSAYELETQLIICQRRAFGNQQLRIEILKLLDEVQKMIYSYQIKIENTFK